MAAFRFCIREDDSTTYTLWADETRLEGGSAATAPLAIAKLRAANPDARISTERRAGTAEQLNSTPNDDAPNDVNGS